MGSALFQTTLFWAFSLDYWLKWDYLPTPNNYDYLINSYLNAYQSKRKVSIFGSWSQKWKCACFLIPNLEKEQKICLFPAYFVIANLEKNNLATHFCKTCEQSLCKFDTLRISYSTRITKWFQSKWKIHHFAVHEWKEPSWLLTL